VEQLAALPTSRQRHQQLAALLRNQQHVEQPAALPISLQKHLQLAVLLVALLTNNRSVYVKNFPVGLARREIFVL
jgi:hypothetical protein